MSDPEIIPLRGPSYLAAIEDSVGSRAYRRFYARIDDEERDVAEGGVLSCAYFVSSLLYLFALIERPHLTVAGTVRDIEASGWERLAAGEPRPGSVLVWEAKLFDDGSRHEHIGFAVGDGEAVSTDYRTGEVTRHPLPSDRALQAAYWTIQIDSEGRFFGTPPGV